MRKKNTSDRTKLKTKYTIQKKRKQRKIKIKRDMKKNPNNYHKKKADPGVPNIAPFKLSLLAERDKHMQEQEVEKQKKRALILKNRQLIRDAQVGQKRKLTDVINIKPTTNDDSDEEVVFPDEEFHLLSKAEVKEKKRQANKKKQNDMDIADDDPEKVAARAIANQLARRAKQQQMEFRARIRSCKNDPEKPDPDARFHNWSDRVYYKQVKQVVDAADVVLEVVDARDPLGTRCSVLESLVRSKASKRLVLVLNKSDLIPKSNLQAWLKHLRAEAPTVAFKAATHRPRRFKRTLDRWVHIGEETLRTPSAMGSDVLLQLLKNYGRSFFGAGIVVGVVGLPNVGKSSLINSLKKVKTCDVAPVPGYTKNIKEIKLDAKLHLLDSPGVVLPGDDMNPVDAVLRNLVKLESVRNPIECALEIFKRSDSMKLAMFYEVRKVEDGEEFLGLLAKRCKKMIRKGLTNSEAAARKLIYDWNHGILKYYTEPPSRSESEVATTLVYKLSPEFELDTLTWNKEDVFMSYQDEGRPSITMKTAASTPVGSCFGLDDDQTMEQDGGEENGVHAASQEEEEEDEIVGEEDDESMGEDSGVDASDVEDY